MTVQILSSEQARIQWRNLLDLAGQGDVDVVIERHGKATATLISYELYQAVQGVLAELRNDEARSRRGQRMADTLQEISALSERDDIADPVQWQIDQRTDRPLVGRDG